MAGLLAQIGLGELIVVPAPQLAGTSAVFRGAELHLGAIAAGLVMGGVVART